MPEEHAQGMISIENKEMFEQDIFYGDLGIQISHSGQVWICINGIAFLRFKPTV